MSIMLDRFSDFSLLLSGRARTTTLIVSDDAGIVGSKGIEGGEVVGGLGELWKNGEKIGIKEWLPVERA